jgi:hypothetical protein
MARAGRRVWISTNDALFAEEDSHTRHENKIAVFFGAGKRAIENHSKVGWNEQTTSNAEHS